MLIALAVVLGLLAVSAYLLVLYRRERGERLALTEYAQFLLLNAESYQDHRRKFVDYLESTGQKTPTERGKDAQRVIETMAASLFGKALLGNIAARNAIVSAASRPLTP
jgi:type II secretory pathway pseudopilin PulG